MKKLPSYLLVLVFVFVSACFLTYQITYTMTDNLWKNRIDDMLASSAPDVSDGLSELSETVARNYLYTADEQTLENGVKDGYVLSLPDNFSMYMDKQEYRNYLDFETSSNNVGVGVNTLYDSRLSGINIINVHKGSPAESSGIVPGDIITHVNSSPVGELGYYGVMKLLGTGSENEKVTLTVRKRTNVDVSLVLSKTKITSERIEGKRMKNGIGLIKISAFETGDEESFKEELEHLITAGCEKFVIDVRNNSGGSLEAISRILDFLSGDGTMFTVTDKSGAKNTITSDANSAPYPLAVLVNERPVCGAEAFAAVLSENELAKLFGVTTYGKASNQSVFTLSDGGAVSLSTTKYLPAYYGDFDGVGVVPDETVDLSDDVKLRFTTLSDEEDAQLQAAIEYLKEQEGLAVKD